MSQADESLHLHLPFIPETVQRMRDIAAKFLQDARDEGYILVGVLARETDSSVIALQNAKGDFGKMMRAATSLVEVKTRDGNVIFDHVQRLH